MGKKILIIIGMVILFTLLVYITTFASQIDDAILISKVVCKEAMNQSELGKKLVADVILNRVDSPNFPNTISGVIKQDGQFHYITSDPPKEIYALVLEELYFRTNSEVLYFKTKDYHKFGTPLFKEGDHYFSGI